MIRLAVAAAIVAWPVAGLVASLSQEQPWRVRTFDENARAECALSPNWQPRGADRADVACYALTMRAYRDELAATVWKRSHVRLEDLDL